MVADMIIGPIRLRSSAAFALLLVLVAASAGAQQATAPDAAPARTQPAPSGLPTPPEVIGAIGRFIDQSITNVGAGVANVGAGVGAGVKGAGETLGGATSAAGDLAKGVTDAAGTVARLPLSNVVSGWERCVIAPNGAPDCVAASTALCNAKGFARGNSLDITSARKCPASAWLQGRTPSDAECANESFVSRAICQ
jgi:hypothetical protein